MRRVLLISPYFPPIGVSGAKRALHLARNLPAAGWQPIVLAGPPVGERPDPTLSACVPPGTVVSYGFGGALRSALHALKARRAAAKPTPGPKKPPKPHGWRPSWWPEDATFLTPFDRYLADVPAGLRAARALVRRHRPDAIHVSADPWSPLIAADRLARETGLPLIVDLRDPWSQHAAKMALRPAPARAALRAFERRLFHVASKVVLNTEAARDAYVAAYAGDLPADHFTAIRNAFDEGLFRPGEAHLPDAFTVAYFGRFRRFVEPDALLRGFRAFVDGRGLGPADARLRFIGGLDPEHKARVAALALDPFVDVVPPVPFRDSLPVLRSAHVLSMVIQPDSHLQIPGKLYDYLCARRPILSVSANPEADRIVAAAGAGLCARHGDPADVAEKLGRLYDGAFEITAADVEPFSARAQASAMAAVYDEALER